MPLSISLTFKMQGKLPLLFSLGSKTMMEILTEELLVFAVCMLCQTLS